MPIKFTYRPPKPSTYACKQASKTLQTSKTSITLFSPKRSGNRKDVLVSARIKAVTRRKQCGHEMKPKPEQGGLPRKRYNTSEHIVTRETHHTEKARTPIQRQGVR